MTRPLLIAVLIVSASAIAPAPALAADDFKFVAATACAPYPPTTTSAELQLSTSGLYNPGSAIERVLCPMPRDQDDRYLSGDVDVVAYYRGLTSTPGRMSCTLYVGSPSMQSTAVYTVSGTGPYVANGARNKVVIVGAGQSQSFWAVPVNVLCSLDPKVSFAGLFFNERGPTHFE